MADTIEETIIENLLDCNAYIYLRADSIDWESHKGEYWKDTSFRYKFYMYSSRFVAANTTTAYHEREVRYNDLPLIGELLAHKVDGEDGVSILEFLSEIHSKGVDELVYDNDEVRHVSIEKIFQHYNYVEPESEPRKLLIGLCDYNMFNAPYCARRLTILEDYLKKRINGYELIVEFYKKLTMEQCFQYLALCPYFEEACAEGKYKVDYSDEYLEQFKALLEFVVFSYFMYKNQQIYILLDEDNKPVASGDALQVLYRAKTNLNLLPVNGIDSLKDVMRESGLNSIVYTDLTGYSAHIREDIINGMIPTVYFFRQGRDKIKNFKIDAISLPQEVKDKLYEDFEKKKNEDEHAPDYDGAAYYAREYGYRYEQYIKYVVNGEKD